MADLSLHESAFGSYLYRGLRKGDRGADVYALQTCLDGTVGDGIFGPRTHDAVVHAQSFLHLRVDAVAGIATQTALVKGIILNLTGDGGPPEPLVRGQVEHESGYEVGNFTPVYPSNGSRDRGVCQLNSKAKEPDAAKAFDAPSSVLRLCEHLKTYHGKYKPHVGDHEAWKLAAGAWNAPAWADAIALGRPISYAHRQLLEAYIRRVCAYFP